MRADVEGNPRYSRYRPRPYRRRMPIFWWLRSFAYTKFITRELTALFVAYTALLLLALARAVTAGPEAYEDFLAWLGRPWVLGLHAIVLVALLLHSVTWLGLAPKAMVFRLRGRRVPDTAVLAGHYAAWAAVSLLVVWLLLGLVP